jgi:hypothetical protein
MTVSIFARCKVKDFDVWKEHFDNSAEFSKRHGVIASNVLRDLDDPNLVIVHQDFAEADAAKTFYGMVNSDMFMKGEPVTKGGVIPETVVTWLGKIV